MYQLQHFQKDKNIEVTNKNAVEFLSHIGLKLERMLAFVYTRNKVIRDEKMDEDEIYEKGTETGIKVTKPPDY